MSEDVVNDVVNKPEHYQGRVECIEAIEAATAGLEGIEKKMMPPKTN